MLQLRLSLGHVSPDCQKEKAECTHCQGRGHLSKYCFVLNSKPLPERMHVDTKAKIERLRKERKDKQADSDKAASFVVPDNLDAIGDDFWEALDRETTRR